MTSYLKDCYRDGYTLGASQYDADYRRVSGGSIWDNLLAYWSFNGSVTTPPDPDYYGNDALGVSNFAVVSAGPTSGVTGKSGYAVTSPQNTSDYLDLTGSLITPFVSALAGAGITASAWVQPSSASNIFRIGWLKSPPGTAFYLGTTSASPSKGTAYSTDSVSGTVQINTVTGMSGGTWHFLCGGYDPSVKKTFVSLNGDPKIYSATALTNGPKYATVVDVAAVTGSVVGYSTVDELAVFSGVLSDDQIAELYNGGDGLFYGV